MDDNVVNHQMLKLASVPAALVAGLSWGDIASMLAACYTVLLIIDFLWVKVMRPQARKRGWVTPTNHGDLK